MFNHLVNITQQRWVRSQISQYQGQSISNFNVLTDHLKIMLEYRFEFTRLGTELRLCFSTKLPGDPDAAGLAAL